VPIFPADFERGVNFTMSNAGLWQTTDTDRMVQRAKYLNFTHVFFTFALGLNPASSATGTSTSGGWEVGIGPVNVGGSMPNGSFTYGRLDLTPADAVVRQVIQKCNAIGLKCRLRPWIYPSTWRANINPSAVGKTAEEARAMFLTSLTNAMVHYATIAAEEGADGMSVGSEYAKQSSDSRWPPGAGFVGATQMWRDLVSAVRVAIGPGPLLSYGANEFAGTGFPYEWTAIDWWNHPDLDYIGIDFYGSLAKLNERRSDGQYLRASDIAGRLKYGIPEDLFATKNKPSYITLVKNVSAAAGGKPIIFEEYGFASVRRSDGDAVSQPIFEALSGFDNDIQYQATKGFLDSLRGEPLIKGAYVWEMNRLNRNSIADNGLGDYASAVANGLHGTIGKPVEELFRVYFDQAGSFPPAPKTRSAPRFRE
jgi:hypothetical protein